MYFVNLFFSEEYCENIEVFKNYINYTYEFVRSTDERALAAPNNPVWIWKPKYTSQRDLYIFNTGSKSGYRMGKQEGLTTGKSYYKGMINGIPCKLQYLSLSWRLL